MPLPSEMRFVSFLNYSPRGQSEVARTSRTIVQAIKNDAVYPTSIGKTWIIPYTARKIREARAAHPCLAKAFSPGIIAVPAPRSSLLVTGGLWPAQKICESLHAEGLVASVHALLARSRAVTKSATASPSNRPTPARHYESLEAQAVLPPSDQPMSFVIVDDVITRGATLLACFAKLREAYPDSCITCFALARTMSDGDIQQLVEPIAGTVTSEPHLHREP